MKRIQLLALGALLALVGQSMHPYVIMNDKDSESSATVYVFRNAGKYVEYLKARGVPDDVIKGFGVAASAAPLIGGVLAAPTAGGSAVVAAGVVIGTAASASLVKALQDAGLMDKAILKLAGIIAVHKDIAPGFGVENDGAAIEKEFGLPSETTLYLVATDKRNGLPLLSTTVGSSGTGSGRTGFIIKKNDKGELYAQFSAAARDQYEPSKVTKVKHEESWWDKAKGAFDDSTSGVEGFFGSLKDTAASAFGQATKAGEDLAKQDAAALKAKQEAAKEAAEKTNK